MNDVKSVASTEMTNAVQTFQNKEFGNIRTILIDSLPWFVGRDVAAALGYKETAKAVRDKVDEEDKGVSILDTPGGKQRVGVINESGVYALIFGSKLESAKRFKRWVTSEVLPTIFKTGTYSVQKQEPLKTVENMALMNDKLARLETARKQDRAVIDNVLFVCKQLSQQIQTLQAQGGSYTPRQNPKGQSEWRAELYDIVHKIGRLAGLPVNAVMSQAYHYMELNYGWYMKDARKEYIEKFGYKGDPKNLSGVDIIEASDMYKSIFMSIIKDRLEKEKHDAECKKGVVSSLVKAKHPATIPAEALAYKSHVTVDPAPEVVAEAHAVEIENPSVDMKPSKAKPKSYYKPSILRPVVEPIAIKLGDKSYGYQLTYRRIYEIVGVNKIDRMSSKYLREHNKPAKSKAALFMESDKAFKVFKDAANKLAETI